MPLNDPSAHHARHHPAVAAAIAGLSVEFAGTWGRRPSMMEAPTQLQNCHRDLWADNMLPTPAGGICLIDWENCGLADPAQEIPMALVDFGGGDQHRIAAIYRAYLDSGGPGRVTGPGSFTMVIAQFGHIWESAVRTYVSPNATDDQRAHSMDRIAELLSPPFRPHHIEETLVTLGRH